ncbi:MAG: secondary thiamine-phosphate synthase enzyme YjbQ [Oceanococcus sp.]
MDITTRGRGCYEITPVLERWLSNQTKGDQHNGLLHIFIRHTSASLIVCENADPDVLIDLQMWMENLVQDGDARFRHTAEGRDDMAAHIRSVLTSSQLALPVRAGRLALGTWQGVFLWEHRYAPQQRELLLDLS